MSSAEPIKLHLPYEVMLGDGRSLTMLLLNPYVWYRTCAWPPSAACNIGETETASVRTSLRALR
jgi:hypothetical protein